MIVRRYVLFQSADGLEKKERVYCRPNVSCIYRVATRSLRCVLTDTSALDFSSSIQRRTYYIRDIKYIKHKKYAEAIYVYKEDL